MSAFWAQRNSRERFLIIAAVMAAVIAILVMLFPAGSGASKLLPAAQARQKYQTALKQKTAMSSEMDKLKPEIDKLVYKDTPEQLIPAVIKSLQGHAKTAGIHLREIKPNRARRLAGITKVPLTLRFSSRFDQSIPFLYNVEDPNGKLVVEKFNITMSDPKAKTVDVEVQISMFTEAMPTLKAGDDGV